jgi:hypothetical protein
MPVSGRASSSSGATVASELFRFTAPPSGRARNDEAIGLLSCETGGALGELIDATYWLPHTMRTVSPACERGFGFERSRADSAPNYPFRPPPRRPE